MTRDGGGTEGPRYLSWLNMEQDVPELYRQVMSGVATLMELAPDECGWP